MIRIACLAALVGATPLYAADFRPTRFDDPSPNGCLPTDCSLREALIAANASVGRDRVVLAAGTYSLSRLQPADQSGNDETRGALWVREDVDFIGQGQGFGGTIVRWSAASTATTSIFFAWDAGEALDVSWSRMRVSHGNDTYGNGCFDLAETYSSYRLDNVLVRDCRGGFGGGTPQSQRHPA